MKTFTEPEACRPSVICTQDAKIIGVPERITLQETIKFGVECLFGSVGSSWVYEQLGLADYLDERLGTAEMVELIAVDEDVMTWGTTAAPKSTSDHTAAESTEALSS